MHVLFVHQSFPAQFGPFAFHLAARPGWRCTFVTKDRSEPIRGVECVPYKLQGGATTDTHYCSRTFENAIWHSHAVFQALAASRLERSWLRFRKPISPDLSNH